MSTWLTTTEWMFRLPSKSNIVTLGRSSWVTVYSCQMRKEYCYLVYTLCQIFFVPKHYCYKKPKWTWETKSVKLGFRFQDTVRIILKWWRDSRTTWISATSSEMSASAPRSFCSEILNSSSLPTFACSKKFSLYPEIHQNLHSLEQIQISMTWLKYTKY